MNLKEFIRPNGMEFSIVGSRCLTGVGAFLLIFLQIGFLSLIVLPFMPFAVLGIERLLRVVIYKLMEN